GLARDRLRREQPSCRHRQGELFPERRWPLDADPQGPAAAESEILQEGEGSYAVSASKRMGSGSPRGWSAQTVLRPACGACQKTSTAIACEANQTRRDGANDAIDPEPTCAAQDFRTAKVLFVASLKRGIIPPLHE